MFILFGWLIALQSLCSLTNHFLGPVYCSEQAIQSPSLQGHATGRVLQQAVKLWIPYLASIHLFPPQPAQREGDTCRYVGAYLYGGMLMMAF